jgi:hypothetical protein
MPRDPATICGQPQRIAELRAAGWRVIGAQDPGQHILMLDPEGRQIVSVRKGGDVVWLSHGAWVCGIQEPTSKALTALRSRGPSGAPA